MFMWLETTFLSYTPRLVSSTLVEPPTRTNSILILKETIQKMWVFTWIDICMPPCIHKFGIKACTGAILSLHRHLDSPVLIVARCVCFSYHNMQSFFYPIFFLTKHHQQQVDTNRTLREIQTQKTTINTTNKPRKLKITKNTKTPQGRTLTENKPRKLKIPRTK